MANNGKAHKHAAMRRKDKKLKEKLKSVLSNRVSNEDSTEKIELISENTKSNRFKSNTKQTHRFASGKFNKTINSGLFEEQSSNEKNVGSKFEQKNKNHQLDGNEKEQKARKKEDKQSKVIETNATENQTNESTSQNGIRKNKRSKKKKNKSTGPKSNNAEHQRTKELLRNPVELKEKKTCSKSEKKRATEAKDKSMKKDIQKRKHTELSAEETNPIKRRKHSNGFVESNMNDVAETKRIEREIKKQKNKLKKSKKSQPCESSNQTELPVMIHNVAEHVVYSETNSDSENDSYIDRFFHDNDKEFNENRIYSPEEIENEKCNDFLSKDSENVSKTNRTIFSDNSKSNKNVSNCTEKRKQKSFKLPIQQQESENEHDDDKYNFTKYFGIDDMSHTSESDTSYGSDVTESDASYGSDVIESDDQYSESSSFDSSVSEEYSNSDEYDHSSESDEENFENEYNEHGSETSESTCSDLFSHQYSDEYDSNNDSEYTGKKTFFTHLLIQILLM